MKHKFNKRVLAVTAALALVLGTAAVSAAYWTDKKEIHSTVEAMNIGIRHDKTALDVQGSKYVPGDSNAFSFTVSNTGTVSVDIRPEIRISSSKPMTKDRSAFRLVNAGGEDITGYKVSYQDKQGNEVENGEPYDAVVYLLENEVTLAGSVHNDAEKSETEKDHTFSYYLKLNEATGNDFQDAAVSIDVSTYAIQHRNRTDHTTEWIKYVTASSN